MQNRIPPEWEERETLAGRIRETSMEDVATKMDFYMSFPSLQESLKIFSRKKSKNKIKLPCQAAPQITHIHTRTYNEGSAVWRRNPRQQQWQPAWKQRFLSLSCASFFLLHLQNIFLHVNKHKDLENERYLFWIHRPNKGWDWGFFSQWLSWSQTPGMLQRTAEKPAPRRTHPVVNSWL